MTGTFLNIATVLIGGTFGLLFGARLPERVRQTVIAGLGLFTAGYGLLIFLRTENPLVVLASILIGGLLGEWWRIEDGLRGLGKTLEEQIGSRLFVNRMSQVGPGQEQRIKTSSDSNSQFVRGFLTASLAFCVGPMTILGSIQDGLTGDFSTLAIKSVLDGFASLAFASTLGIGVMFSTLVILVYQGGLSLLAAQAQSVITESMMNEMTAAGGILLLGIAISSLLEIKPIRIGNFLPALLVAPLIVAILLEVGIPLVP
jgi:uncharacterized protein